MLPGLPHWLLQVVNQRFRMWFSSYTHYRIFSHYVLKYLIITKFYQLWHHLERSVCHPCIACNKVSLLFSLIVWFHVPMSFFETEYQQLFIIRLYATYKTLLEHCLKICAVLTYCQSSLPNHFYMRKCTLQLAAQFFHFRILWEWLCYVSSTKILILLKHCSQGRKDLPWGALQTAPLRSQL